MKAASGGHVAAPGSHKLPSAKAAKGLAEGSAKEKAAASKASPPEGMVIPSLHGDLKMVIAGDSGVKLSVIFREFPKSRRHRVLSKSEARREHKVVPLMAKMREEMREAVIETAREGIYIFMAEPENGVPARATFTLKIYETGAREKITAIGSRTVAGKVILAKVLMPDAILWDEDSAFTGSMEDSGSITKFNAETGLYWKEYKE